VTRGRTLRPLIAPVVLAALAAAPAAAQTTDALFAGWRWSPVALGSRPAGLGGAFVAVADGKEAASANPAGLALIPAWEVGGFSGSPWIGAAGGGRRPIRVAAYFTRSETARVDLAEAGGPGASGAGGGASPPAGFLEGSTSEAGLAFGAEPFHRLRIGASLAWSRLHLEGERTTEGAAGAPATGASLRSDDGHLRFGMGVLVTVVGPRRRSLPSLRFGLSYQPGFDWSAELATGLGSGPTTIVLRRPSLVTAGLAWRPSDRWLFTGQGDLIRYGEVVAAVRRNVGGEAPGFRLPSTVEPRAGGEYSTPLACGCGIVKLRAGIHYRSPGTLRFVGPDAVPAAAFRNPGWRTVATLGASFLTEFFAHAIRVDVDAKDVFEGPGASFGVVWRF
jgi:hypothetical protein